MSRHSGGALPDCRGLVKYTHILFDHDGVLVDTEHLYFRATREILTEVGFDLPIGLYLALQAEGKSAWEHAKGVGLSAARADELRQARNVLYQRYLVEEDIEIPGVVETLKKLGRRCSMAIVTTAKKEDFALIHRDRNIVEHMDFVLANGDYARSKPQPDPYLAGLERFGVSPDRALVVEDSERGLRSAVAAGIDCAVVHHEFTASQDFSRATYKLDSLAELVDLLN